MSSARGKAFWGEAFYVISILCLNIPFVTHLTVSYSISVLLASRAVKEKRTVVVQGARGSA